MLSNGNWKKSHHLIRFFKNGFIMNTLTLSQFECIEVNSSSIIVYEHYTDNNEMFYSSTIVLFLSNELFPITLNTTIVGDNYFDVIGDTCDVVSTISGNISNVVYLLDENGDIIEKLFLDEIIREDECSNKCEQCTCSKGTDNALESPKLKLF